MLRAGKLLQRARCTQNLAITFSTYSLDEGTDTRSDAVVDQLNTVFSQSHKWKPGVMLQLEKLHHKHMDLSSAGGMISTVAELRGLRHLQLEDCLVSDTLLEGLTQMQLPLRTLAIDIMDQIGLDTLGAFLGSLKASGSLSRLRLTGHLSLSNKDSEIVNSLVRLAPSLQLLELRDVYNEAGLFPYADLSSLQRERKSHRCAKL